MDVLLAGAGGGADHEPVPDATAAALRGSPHCRAQPDPPSSVLHPPAVTQTFGDPDALDSAYAARQLVRLPLDPASLGLSYDPRMGSRVDSGGVAGALPRARVRPRSSC